MQDPSMRILTVLEYLQSRDSISGQELADRLEVSLRTVQRYIVRLQDLGVPVVSTPVANLSELEGLITVTAGVEGFLTAIEEQLESGRFGSGNHRGRLGEHEAGQEIRHPGLALTEPVEDHRVRGRSHDQRRNDAG